MDGHPQAVRARTLLDAVSAGRLDVLEQQMTDDIVWHVGGTHPLSGDYRGKRDVVDYLKRVASLTRGSLRLDVDDILASDQHLGIFLNARATSGSAALDTTMVEAVRLDAQGRWAEFWALADDQQQVDEFWKAVAK